jgi:hypothetical protein
MESIENRLNWLWINGHQNKIKANTENISVVGVDTWDFMDGTSTFYGFIQFDRWYDESIFHKVVENRYKPNKLGEKVGIARPFGGGSAWLRFNPSEIDKVVSEMKKKGYTIQLKIKEKCTI